jgi:hypothetical protein
MTSDLLLDPKSLNARFTTWWLTPRRTMAIYLLRLGLGVLSLLFFVQHFQDRHFLWGVHGEIDWPFYAIAAAKDPLALYAWSSSALWSELVYALSIFVCLWFIAGYFPQCSALCLFAVLHAAFQRNWDAIDGGHNILLLLVLYLALSNNPASKQKWRVEVLLTSLLPRIGPFVRDFQAATHNAAVVLVLGQIWMLYFWSGFYKVAGDMWRNGTAVYYVMRVSEFNIPGISHLIYEHGLLITILTYSVVMLQLLFPLGMWVSRFKPYLFTGAVLFHLGIAFFMGLALFSFTMIVADLALFSDEAYAHIAIVLSKVRRNLPSVIGQSKRTSEEARVH